VNPAINVGADITLSTPVNRSLGLIKAGARYVNLNGAVTGFGPGVYTNVTAGTLVIGPATPLDWTAISKTVGGGTLRLDAVTTTNIPLTLAGAGSRGAQGALFFNNGSCGLGRGKRLLARTSRRSLLPCFRA
jgi:hypothetical protein